MSSDSNAPSPPRDGGSSGRGNGRPRSGQGGRGNHFRTGRRNNQFQRNRFEGREKALAGHIYDYNGERTPDKYIRTTKEIANYVGRTFTKYPGDFTAAKETLELDDPDEPNDPDPNDQVAFEHWKLNIKDHRTKMQEYANFRASLYSLVFEQCTDAMQERLKSHEDFEAASQDGIALLVIVRSLIHTFEEKRNLADSLCDVKESFYKLRQGKHMSLEKYHELFVAQVAVLDEVGITVWDQALVDNIAESNGRGDEPEEEDYEEAKQRALAIRFIRGTNENHKGYIKHLRNSHLDNHDNYPKTVSDAFNILQRRDEDTVAIIPENDGVAFAQTSTHGRDMSQVICYNCGGTGHYARDCPHQQGQEGNGNNNNDDNNNNGESTEVNAVTFSFSQSNAIVPKTWILLDSQSTVDCFSNRALLKNIRKTDKKINIYCNAGRRTIDVVGDLQGYGEVWHDPKGIANVLSLSRIRKKYGRVDYVAKESGGEFTVYKPDGKRHIFKEAELGLHYLDTSSPNDEMHDDGHMLVVNTVRDNKSKYTNNDYMRALRARELQIKIGRPSTRDYIKIVEGNSLPNCPVTRADILAAEHIFGPDIGALKGKTTRRRPPIVDSPVTPVPNVILEKYRRVTICVDVLHINNIPMLASISRNIKFGTVEAMASLKEGPMLEAIKHICQVYRRAGFKVESSLMDGAFSYLKGALADMGIALNDTSRDEHVGDVERYIRTMKERIRATYNTLPFKKIPGRLVIEMAKSAVFWLNGFPIASGVSQEASPRTIITGQKLDYSRHCKYQFGEYCQTHEEHDNSMNPRTIGALALRPTGNAQGSYYFLSLSTGGVINRLHATALPMPDDVIDRVHRMARQQKANPGLVFGDRNNLANILDLDDDDEDNDDFNPNEMDKIVDEYDEYDDPEDEIADNEDENQGVLPVVEEEENQGVLPVMDVAENEGVPPVVMELEPENDAMDPIDDDADVDDVPIEEEQEEWSVSNTDENNDPVMVAAEEGDNESHHDEEESGNRENEGRYSLRSRRTRDNSYRYNPEEFDTNDRENEDEDGAVMAEVAGVEDTVETPRMSLKLGLKKFGEEGLDAVRKEMRQLHDRKVMRSVARYSLTPKQRRDALAYLMFLKRKRTGKVKGRGCADGRKQRDYIPKEDSTSPTVKTESVLLTAAIDAKEKRDVAVVDVPGAFMQADMDDIVHIRFTGEMLEMLLEIDPCYASYICYERGEKALYVVLDKALYGTLKAARLFWEMLSKQLVEWGFVVNPYDQCVANKECSGGQLTVTWHVDDIKVSHKSSTVVDQFIQQMEETFGKEGPLTISRGKVHDYLGMILDYSVEGSVIIRMESYINNMINDMPEDMIGVASTPASSSLFKVNTNGTPTLNPKKKEIFVHLVMQALYLSQRGRPDIRTAVSFLCGRLTCPDEDDYSKLSRMMKYLQGTRSLPLTLRVEDDGKLQWWIDASYAVHPNMRGHTGATMSMGKGSVFSGSWKQKMVTRSSTESEVVGVHDVLPQILWTKMFLEAQGFSIAANVLYQDNLSAILLEKNGRQSSTKRTKHMHLRYFYITDQVKKGEISIEHCPTKDMIADFFTKPLQGHLFHKLRNLVMGMDPPTDQMEDPRSVLKHEDRRTNDSEAGHSEAMPITTKTKLVHQGDKKSYWNGSSNTDGDTSQPQDNKKGKDMAGSDAGVNVFGMTTTRSYRDILIGEGRGRSN